MDEVGSTDHVLNMNYVPNFHWQGIDLHKRAQELPFNLFLVKLNVYIEKVVSHLREIMLRHNYPSFSGCYTPSTRDPNPDWKSQLPKTGKQDSHTTSD